MQLGVEIGSTVKMWRLGEDDSFDAWANRCPWRSGEVSQIIVLRLARLRETDRIQLAVRSLILAADEGVYSPKILFASPSPADDFSSKMTECIFGRALTLDRVVFKRMMLDRLNQAPHVCQLLVSAARADDLLREAQEVLDDLNREECLYPLIVVILSEGLRLISRPYCFDMASAMPINRVISSQNLDPGVAWKSYLHSRAAWECGGDIHLAQVYGSEWKRLQQFDDEALEKSCSVLAIRRWAEVSEVGRAEWRRQLDGGLHDLRINSVGGSNLITGLREEGLLWRAPGHCRLMPTAWAIRATAALQMVRGALCRAALVNSPLVAEILTWCFELEACEREEYDKACDWSDAADSLLLHANFVGNERSSPAFLYPRNYPVLPSFKDFETFGGFCRRLGANSRLDSRRRLLALRNALCHGHHGGWKAVEALLSIHARLTYGNPP